MYLLPCPFKYLTGYDCPGCGFQRAVLALIKGDFHESFHLYPPAIPILLTVIISLGANRWFPSKSKVIRNTLFAVSCCFMLINYGFKIFLLQSHMPHL